MLRGTVAAFAAGVGGADAVTVVPFDEPLGLPDAFGRRIARNTSSLLIEESHVAAVTDPAGGSYAVEKLTDDLAVAGWAELGRIESDGGALADEARTGVKERVHAIRHERDARDRGPLAAAHRHLGVPEPRRDASRGEHLPDRAVHRYGSSYEDMRARRRAHRSSSPPWVRSPRTPRAPPSPPTCSRPAASPSRRPARPTTSTRCVAAYAGQPVVCLAGTDAAYAEWGADLVAALRAAGASYVVLAGKPGEKTVTDVDDSCAMGVDALGFLGRIREELSR